MADHSTGHGRPQHWSMADHQPVYDQQSLITGAHGKATMLSKPGLDVGPVDVLGLDMLYRNVSRYMDRHMCANMCS